MSNINLNEMNKAVENSLKYLNNIIESLEKAEKLSVADMAGGKMIISKAKYDAIDQANESEDNFESWYRKLVSIPAYQQIDLNLRVEIDKGVKIMDIFFDNIAIDIYVQTKISSVLKEAEAVQEKLLEVRRSIKKVLA